MFGVIVVPLSCLKLQSQIIFQNVMSVVRIVVVLSMVLWSIVVPPVRDEPAHGLTDFNFQNWLAVVPISVGSLAVHFMVPTLCQYVRDKSALGSVVKISVLIVILLDLSLGIAVSYHFQEKVVEFCSLNWSQFTEPEHSSLVRTYAYFLLIYPSIDLCSTFPLIVSVGSNVFLALIQDSGIAVSGKLPVVCRFCFATVPLIGSLYIANTMMASEYNGLLLVFLVFVIPPLLQICSKKKCLKIFKAQQLQNNETSYLLSSLEDPVTPGLVGETPYQTVLGKSFLMVISSLVIGLLSIVATTASWHVSTK
eukprot:m.75267 g.75267  ORF g.75267 m.75267 type:complete len:308 (+) comp35935_c0_seq2:1060-1983(+)